MYIDLYGFDNDLESVRIEHGGIEVNKRLGQEFLCVLSQNERIERIEKRPTASVEFSTSHKSTLRNITNVCIPRYQHTMQHPATVLSMKPIKSTNYNNQPLLRVDQANKKIKEKMIEIDHAPFHR